MSRKTFQLDLQGGRDLMRSKEMIEILEDAGNNAVKRLGPGYKINTHVGKNRANVMVYADSVRAKRDNAKNNSILKALK